MSISTGNNQEPEITRSRLMKKDTIYKVMEKTTGLIQNSPVAIIMVFSYLITAISELLNNEMSWKWYLALLVITTIFTIDKFRKNSSL